METTMLQITSYGWDVASSGASSRASSGANYISHKRSYLEHCSFQNITPANYNTLSSVYLGLNLFKNNGNHYNIVNSS